MVRSKKVRAGRPGGRTCDAWMVRRRSESPDGRTIEIDMSDADEEHVGVVKWGLHNYEKLVPFVR